MRIKIQLSNHKTILIMKIIIEINQGNLWIQASIRNKLIIMINKILNIIIKEIKVMKTIIKKISIEVLILMKKTNIENNLILMMKCQ